MIRNTSVVKFLPTPAGLVIFVALASMGQDGCRSRFTVGTTTCLGCHDGRSAPDQREFLSGAHHLIACEECHGPGYDHVRNGGRHGLFIDNPGRLPFSRSYQLCEDCHEPEVDAYLQTAHSNEGAARCTDCHDVHKASGLAVDAAKTGIFDNDVAEQLCGRCHAVQVEEFLESVHVVLGVAACGNCHNMHRPQGLALSLVNNDLCLQCHASSFLGFDTEAAVDFHTGLFHPVDPEGSGASRCTSCHLPPLEQLDEPDGIHRHTLFTIPPLFSNDAADAGVIPVPPNSCAGIPGCHDPDVPGSGAPHDVNLPSQNEALQPLYESIGDVL